MHFASHDFSAVSPPVDTINESEAPMETAAGLLSNILVEKKRVQHSSPTALQSAGKALQVLAEAALLAQKQPDASNEIEAAALVCLESKCGAQLLCKIAQLTKVALRTVASSARILSEEFLVTDQEIDGEAFSLSSSSSSIPTSPGPIRSTLSQFLVSAIRYHLRRLLNAPPPPATSPNTVQVKINDVNIEISVLELNDQRAFLLFLSRHRILTPRTGAGAAPTNFSVSASKMQRRVAALPTPHTFSSNRLKRCTH